MACGSSVRLVNANSLTIATCEHGLHRAVEAMFAMSLPDLAIRQERKFSYTTTKLKYTRFMGVRFSRR